MGLQQSKDALLYEQVNYGNANGIRSLRREGAGLEWIDKEGKTPLILACMRPELLHVAAVLIELGANVNAYRPGSHAGTPLHHAAKRGLVQTVELLLSHRANPLVMNDDCQTALDLARAKSHWNVVRLIESRISRFSGWLREANLPSMLEAIVRQWVSRKIWVVVLPIVSRDPTTRKLELAIYPELQAAKPRVVVSLWKAHIEEPIFSQSDPAVVIVDKTKKIRYKFLSETEGDKQQLRRFYDACRGISHPSELQNQIPAPPAITTVPNTPPQPNSHASTTQAGTSQPPLDDVELATAINASIQSAIAEGVPLPDHDFNGWGGSVEGAAHANWGPPETKPPFPKTQDSTSLPSAPPIAEETFYAGPIRYPSIDSSQVEITVPVKEENNSGEGSSISGSCVICLDAPAEGACIPCGHVAGCMSCLNEIKNKKWGCPVCRADIDQIIKLYAV